MQKKRAFTIYITFVSVALLGMVGVFFLNQTIHNRELEKRQLQLENIHFSAINQLRSNINQFAAISASLRTFFDSHEEIPSAVSLQSYTNNLLTELNFNGRYVVSVIDSNHRFIYVLDKNEIDPNNLAGSFIPQKSDEEIIARMDSIMLTKEISMSRPINLYEGWLGISFAFSLFQEGNPVGYVTPILSLKEILESIYAEGISDDFVFKFKTTDGEFFDRTQIYNRSRKSDKIGDVEFFKNYDVEDAAYIESSIKMFNQTFSVSTAFKEALPYFNISSSIIITGFMIFILGFAFITIQALQLRKLNSKLLQSQEVINLQKNELEDQNQELKKIDKGKNMLFSIIGHDLKSPMVTISTMLDLLSKDLINEEERKNLLDRLKKSTITTLDLLENLLKWAMLNTTNVTFNKEDIDLVELAKQERKNVNERINQKGLKLELKLDESLIIHADKRMIETAMRNIISNAIKFTPTGGQISIFGERSDDCVTLYISDTGVGMDKEQQEKLFAVGHKNVTEDTEGHISTGFGLTLTKELIEQNGGTIQVESIPASGTTFELNFASLDPQQEEKLAD